MELRLNTGAKPENLVFSDWQLKAIEAVSINGLSPIGSKDVLNYVTKGGLKISRGSINRFLEELYGLGLLIRCDQSDGERMRFGYTMLLDRVYFDKSVFRIILKSLIVAFPDVRHFNVLRVLSESL